MKFGDLLLMIRTRQHLTREELSKKSGVSVRAIAYYELDGMQPKSRKTIELLAAALNVAAEELTGEAPLSTPACAADALTRQIQSLYAGGTLREEDMDNMMLAIQEAYLIAKKKKTRDRMKGNQND